MELMFMVWPVLLAVVGALGLIVLVRRAAKARKSSAQSSPANAGYASPSDDADIGTHDPARPAEPGPAEPDNAPAYAARLARVRAAHHADNPPAAGPDQALPEPAPPTPDADLLPEPAPIAIAPRPFQPEPPTVSPRAGGENVTAVLRRQVPLRAGPPRSWLGGMPMMPEHIAWPRGVDDQYPERGPIALHFLAQIACADLPADLWGGIGPRDGWLLFFINPNHFSAEDGDLHRVIHITEIGPERRPPDDCGPVHDKVYTGGSYNWLAAEDVPPVWRCWPVDIVAMPNGLTLHEDESATWKTASPDNLSDLLYADVPLTGRDDDGAAPPPPLRPLTFGQAREAVEALGQSLRYKVREPVDPEARTLLLAEDGQADLIAELAEGRERLAAMPRESLGEGQLRRLAFLEAAVEEFAAKDGPALLETIEIRHAEWLVWREMIAKGCDQIAAMLGRSDPEALLTDDHWEQLKASFAGKHFDHLELRHLRYRTEGPQTALMSPRDIIEIKPPRGLDQIAIEYYLDPARRDRLPAGYAAAQEPAWRALYSNRPHRMGGYHDGLQSEPIEDADFGKLLLLQLASDDAMDWCWGDGGVYFFWIRPGHLAAGDFSQVEVWLECH